MLDIRHQLKRVCVCVCSPLKRMTVGMLFAALAFVAAALVQLQIDVSVTHKTIQT